MLLAQCLLLSSTVLQAQLLLYQKKRFQFVAPGHTAQIQCMSTETIFNGLLFSWYKRRGDELSVVIEKCDGNESYAKFICRVEGQKVILEISSIKTDDSGLYFCATKQDGFFSFSNGSSLIAGGSYTPSARVMLLLPPAQPAPSLMQSSHIACVVHGVSNLVQMSWDVPGEHQQVGLTRLVKNSSGSFTFVSVLQVPRDSQRGGKNFTCEVRFNSSGPSVKKSVSFPAPPSTGSDGECWNRIVPVAVVGMLALLTLLMIVLWIRFCPSRPGFLFKINEPPSSEVLEDGVCYAQLDFPSRSCDRKKRRQAPQGGNLKIGTASAVW